MVIIIIFFQSSSGLFRVMGRNKSLLTPFPIRLPMAKEKKMERKFQCLDCYKTHDDEQAALDCCGSATQSWWTNYNRWGKQHWYGR